MTRSDPTRLGSVRLGGPHHLPIALDFDAPMPVTCAADYETFNRHLHATTDAMRRCGGGFLEALALTLLRADPANRRQLYGLYAERLADYIPGGRFCPAASS